MPRFGGYGWRPDLPDGRDHLLSIPFFPVLPETIDLRPGMPPVYDQGNLGSCTANALAGALEYDQAKQGLASATPSRLFIYYQERVREGTVDQDSGAMIRDGIKACAQLGAPPELLWPYLIPMFTVKPPAAVYAAAAQHRIVRYARAANSKRALRSVLAAGFPIVFGFTVYESFESDAVATTGLVPLPAPDEGILGGHAVLAVGYEPDGAWCRNSWGDAWGAHGYFRLPWDYITNDNLADDFWVVRLTE
jgi:C1A family cysteine protease